MANRFCCTMHAVHTGQIHIFSYSVVLLEDCCKEMLEKDKKKTKKKEMTEKNKNKTKKGLLAKSLFFIFK